jgi:H/ACA ribonucleoprotein complex subunit 3
MIRMAKHIHKCLKCKSYTLKIKCIKCNTETVLPKPPKFSLNDKYAPYRRDVKREDLERQGLI